MDQTRPIQRPRRILWLNVLTVVSAAILISAEVFGAAFAGSWAIASLFSLGASARASSTACSCCRHRRHGAVRPRRAPRRAVHRRVTRAPRLALSTDDAPLLRLVKTKMVARVSAEWIIS